MWARMAREGTSAYLGTADIEVVNSRGSIVRHWSTALSVHFPVRRRFAFPLDSLASGDYKVRFACAPCAPDLPSDRVLPAPTVIDSAFVRVL